jgi:hypothetical protein
MLGHPIERGGDVKHLVQKKLHITQGWAVLGHKNS